MTKSKEKTVSEKMGKAEVVKSIASLFGKNKNEVDGLKFQKKVRK